MNTKAAKNVRLQFSGYSNAAAKFNGVYLSQDTVDSFAANDNGIPDHDPNEKIWRFWLNGTCAYNERTW